MDIIPAWREIALTFHSVQNFVAGKRLKASFEPADVRKLSKNPVLSSAERSVLLFLLHIYNSQNKFELGLIGRWDDQHIAAFGRWVTGKSDPGGFPCMYF